MYVSEMFQETATKSKGIIHVIGDDELLEIVERHRAKDGRNLAKEIPAIAT